MTGSQADRLHFKLVGTILGVILIVFVTVFGETVSEIVKSNEELTSLVEKQRHDNVKLMDEIWTLKEQLQQDQQ